MNLQEEYSKDNYNNVETIMNSVEHFNILLKEFETMTYNFVNNRLKNVINNTTKTLFPKLNVIDINVLNLFVQYLVEKISLLNYFNKDESKYYEQWEHNNSRDIKGVVLLLLPFIDDKDFAYLLKEITDLNQFLYSFNESSIPNKVLKEPRDVVLKKYFKFSNFSLGLINNNNSESILNLYTSNNLKLIYKIIHNNFLGILRSLTIMNGKYYVNWVNIVPILKSDYIDSNIYKETNNGLGILKNMINNNNKLDIYKFISNYNGLWFGDIYNIIKIKLYEEIKQIKWLLFSYKPKNNSNQHIPIYTINYLNNIFGETFETLLNYNSYNDIPDENKKIFTEILRNINVFTDIDIETMWKNIFLFFCNNYSKRKIITNNQQIQSSFNKFSFEEIVSSFIDDDDINDDYSKIIREKIKEINNIDIDVVLKNIEPEHLWNFFYETIILLDSSYLSEYFIEHTNNSRKIKNIYYYPIENNNSLHFKHIYNIAKLLTHYNKIQGDDMKSIWTSYDDHYISMDFDKQINFLTNYLSDSNNNWFNISKNILREHPELRNNDKAIQEKNIKDKQTEIYKTWENIKLNVIFEILITNGLLSKFEVDLELTNKQNKKGDLIRIFGQKLKKNKQDWNEAYYYLNNKQIKTFKPIKYVKKDIDMEDDYLSYLAKESTWYNFYAVDWFSQINFFHHYLNHRVLYVTGATGTGKSTQVPKLLIYGLKVYEMRSTGKIICTQPRITPTTSTAERVSKELGLPIKNEPRHEKKFTDNFYMMMKYSGGSHLKANCNHPTIKIVTDGTLYEEIKGNPLLKKQIIQSVKGNKKKYVYDYANFYDIVMVDESHEHNPNMDMILTLMRTTAYCNNSLRIVITSATMNEDEPVYRSYFRCINDNLLYPIKAPMYSHPIIGNHNLPILPDTIYMDRRIHISSPGESTQHKINETYIDVDVTNKSNKDASEIVQNKGYETVINICNMYPKGEVLFFANGFSDIIKAVKYLNENLPEGNIALPFYSEMHNNYKKLVEDINNMISTVQYDRTKIHELFGPIYVKSTAVPKNTYKRAVIIATNVAEASVTIDGLKFVVDNGYAKVNIYNKESKQGELVVQMISEASRLQRKGRVGRTDSGSVWYLYQKGAREKIMPKYKITEADPTTHYTGLLTGLDKDIDNFIIPDIFNPNIYDNTPFPLKNRKLSKEFKNTSFYKKNIYNIILKQYTMSSNIITAEPQLQLYYWNEQYFPLEIMKMDELKRTEEGFGSNIVGDVFGRFYIIHPYENELMRNIMNEIISFRKVDTNNIPNYIFKEDMKILSNKLLFLDIAYNPNVFDIGHVPKYVKSELYNKINDMKRILDDQSFEDNDIMILFASYAMDCFIETMNIIIMMKQFQNMSNDEQQYKNFKTYWNDPCEIISLYKIYKSLKSSFKNLVIFELIDEGITKKYDRKIQTYIDRFKEAQNDSKKEETFRSDLWDLLKKLYTNGKFNKNVKLELFEYIVIRHIKDDLDKNKINIERWKVANHLKSLDVYNYILNFSEVYVKYLTINKNIDFEINEESPLLWIERNKSNFLKVLYSDNIEEKIMKSFILGLPLNYAIKVHSTNNFYNLYIAGIKGFTKSLNSSILFYYNSSVIKEDGEVKETNIAQLNFVNNINLNYFTSTLPHLFNKNIFRSMLPSSRLVLRNNRFEYDNTYIIIEGDNYNNILYNVNNNTIGYSPWQISELEQLDKYLKKFSKII